MRALFHMANSLRCTGGKPDHAAECAGRAAGAQQVPAAHAGRPARMHPLLPGLQLHAAAQGEAQAGVDLLMVMHPSRQYSAQC